MELIMLYDYAASANCYKVRLLLAQLRRHYERVPVDIFGGDTLTDAFARMNPTRCTPVLELAGGRFLAESNAILVHLAAGTSFLPEESFERAQVLSWLLVEQTDVMMTIGGLRFRLMTGRLAPDSAEVTRRRDSAHAGLAILERHLADREYFVGDSYGVADIGMYGYVHVAADAGIELSEYPAVESWCRRVADQDRYMNDLVPYPANAWPGAGRSIYE